MALPSWRALHRDMDIRQLYSAHLSSLRYNASQRPSKRILRELCLLEEETEVIGSIFSQQNNALKTLREVLDNSSYRITDRVRINAFERIEEPLFEGMAAAYCDTKKAIKQLQDQIHKATQVLRYNIEIAEEGSSKAIMAFTLVTLVFLPLSFVASLLGMSAADIRSMKNTQLLFWEIALPLTAVIGSVCLLVAYRGAELGERIGELRETMRKGRSRRSEMALAPTQSRRRTEEDADGTMSNPLKAPSTLKRRKTAG
ncbi:uncharacterized protein BDZ99DRAFT_171684 [Mytilinidion resinicola]|uniref:Uncharacterized protein n=1 Tax=Mytilinidion resinicola TaxID=574789 RepID=A0A6A6Y6E8_9PEZI|nr:uncharacterized protein BDZ99DRAFT_171684 [Mytilinidion resinicola]KAF2803377.1 hypothetical protein BDZ99DRAFT_171684 [Mytilinidion resinicola]